MLINQLFYRNVSKSQSASFLCRNIDKVASIGKNEFSFC